MFNTKNKIMLAVTLGIIALAGTTGRIGPTQAAEQPQAKEEQPDKSDQERMVGNWHIVNDDSLRKGEMWVIDNDSILMYAKHSGAIGNLYLHRLDAGQDPKQIDITVTLVNGPRIGVIKGLYAIDGDELRVCLGERGKDRPAKFPEKPGPGAVLILHRDQPGAGQPKAKEEQPAAKQDQKESAKTEQKVLTPPEAIAQRPKEGVTVQFKIAQVDAKPTPRGGFGTDVILLRNSGSFTVRLMEPARATILRLGIEPEKYFPGKVVRATGLVEPDPASSSFQIRVNDLNQFLVMKDQADEKQAASIDQKRLSGSWVIVNDDGLRKGEPWILSEDEIVMHANKLGFRVLQHFHRLDATKDPKQIDITVTKTNLEYVGVIKGIYALDSNAERLEWRLCLGELGKDRPAAFPEQPAPGEVLILHRAPEPQVGEQPAAKKDEPPKANKEPEVLTPAEAIKQKDKEQVTVQFEVAAVKMGWSTGAVPKGSKTTSVWWELRDGNNFTVVLKGRAAYQFERLRIDTINHFTGNVIQVTGRVQGKEPTFYMAVDDLDQLEVVR